MQSKSAMLPGVSTFKLTLLAGAIMLVSGGAAAQTSSGSLLQEIERMRPGQQQLPEAEAPALEQRQLPSAKDGEVKFDVKKIEFVGNTKLSQEALDAIVEPYYNSKMTLSQLRSLSDTVAQAYREAGWLVNVTLPKQDVTEGTVKMLVVEAKFGGVKIDAPESRVSVERIEAWIASHMAVGETLSLNDLDRAILTLNDLSDVTVLATLQAGDRPGETALKVSAKDKPLISGIGSVDNFGDPATGAGRTTLMSSVNGPFGYGEQLAFYGLATDGSQYGRLSLSAPVGKNGLKLGVAGSSMSYKVTKDGFNSLNSYGTAQAAAVDASMPIIRSRSTNLYATGSLGQNNFDNSTIVGTTNRYNTKVLQAGLSGNMIDGLGGGGLTQASVNASFGRVDLNDSPLFAADDAGPQTNGSFSKLRFSLNRNQNISDNLSLYASVQGQVANKNLDASEQMYMGGPYGVRAYSSGQGAAAQGTQATVEVRYNLPQQIQVAAFYDVAQVQSYKNTDFAGAPVDNTYMMQGVGASVSWSGPYGIQAKATYAHRVGSPPDSVSTLFSGQASGLSDNRVWLNVSIPF